MPRAAIHAGFPSTAPNGVHHAAFPQPQGICLATRALSPPLGCLVPPLCTLLSADVSPFLYVPSAFPTSFPSLCPVLPGFEALAQTGTFFLAV